MNSMAAAHSPQKSFPVSTRLEQPAQCDGKKREKKSRAARVTTKENPNKDRGGKKDKCRNEPGRHRTADNIWPHPWQEGTRRLGAELGDKLEGLLAKNPPRMETDWKEQRARAQSGICEQHPRDQKRKKTPPKKRPRGRTGESERDLLESTEPTHRSIQRLAGCPHEVDNRKRDGRQECCGMARHHGNRDAKQDASKQKLLERGNRARRGADAKESRDLKVVFKRKNPAQDITCPQEDDRQESQEESVGEVAFPKTVRLKSDVAKTANPNASKGRPKQDDCRDLDTTAEIAMKGKILHNGQKPLLGKPSARPVKRWREETREENHSAKVGKQAQ